MCPNHIMHVHASAAERVLTHGLLYNTNLGEYPKAVKYLFE